ncbi:hypothetical protein D6817_02885 [Candidatus Pacearchaeota archaeon]|nr:MAG: hypothetical protein D6817_02885 [Candidatus Pacearchaeota archaeon]
MDLRFAELSGALRFNTEPLLAHDFVYTRVYTSPHQLKRNTRNSTQKEIACESASNQRHKAREFSFQMLAP